MGRPRKSLECPGAAFMRLTGLWLPQDPASRLLPAIRSCLSVGFLAFLAVSAALKLCMDTPQELEELATCSFALIICSVLSIRVIAFIWYGDTFRQLLQLLDDTKTEHNEGKNNDSTRRSYQMLVERVYLVFMVAVVCSLIGWVSSPLLFRAVLGNDARSRQLPLPIWIPTDVYASPTYEIVYAAQSIGLVVIAVCTTCINTFFIHLMQGIGAEFEVLSDNLSSMQKNHEQTGKARNEGGIWECQSTTEKQALSCADINAECVTSEQIHRQLTKNLQHHQTLLRSIFLLQTTMNVPIFILLTINMLNLCANLFIAAVLLQRDGGVSKALNSLTSIPPLLYETGLYCVFGHVLTDQSEKLLYSAFSCDWIDRDVRFRRDLFMFMTATLQPVELTVGRMTKLSKQTLLQVLNGTYGLLNMLYHFHTNL